MRQILSVLFTFTAGVLLAQMPIQEGARAMSQGLHNSLSILIENADPKFTDKIWKDYLKGFSARPKRIKGYDDTLVDDIDIPGVGLGNTVDLYYEYEKREAHTLLIVWFDLGGAWLSSTAHPERFDDAERFLTEFYLSVQRALIEIKLNNEERRLSDLQSELTRLQREKQRLEQVIADAEKAIQEARAGISKNLSDQEARKKDIEAQQQALENVRQEYAKYKN
jgi:hypothetical protein